MKTNIILASASPRRRELLSLITEDFKVIPSDAEETVPENIETEKMAEYLAEIKAKAVAEKYPLDIVIGSDTFRAYGDTRIYLSYTYRDLRTCLRRRHMPFNVCRI